MKSCFSLQPLTFWSIPRGWGLTNMFVKTCSVQIFDCWPQKFSIEPLIHALQAKSINFEHSHRIPLDVGMLKIDGFLLAERGQETRY